MTTTGGSLGHDTHLCFVTVTGFVITTWALFARHSWWESAALAAAVLGLIALVPYWAAGSGRGETTGTTAWNAFVHIVMVAGVVALLVFPGLERWVNTPVMSG